MCSATGEERRGQELRLGNGFAPMGVAVQGNAERRPARFSHLPDSERNDPNALAYNQNENLSPKLC